MLSSVPVATQFLMAFTSMFVALDIIGTVPMYLSMTQKLTRAERSRVVNTSMAVALVVALLFMVAGAKIFKHLGITIGDFRIAGGLILLLVALADLLGGPDTVHRGTGATGIVPLAVPLITGPGVLTTVVLQVGSFGYPITIAALAVNYLIAWGALRNSALVTRTIGADGTMVLSKIAALLLAAISVSMIRLGVVDGVRDAMVLLQNR